MKATHKVELTTHAALLPERSRLRIELFYSPADPFAVTRTFLGEDCEGCPGGCAAAWTIGRDLLRAGLHGVAGIGDVQVWPAGDGVHVIIGLSDYRNPDAEPALIEMSRTQLAKFLHHTTDLVCYGGEDMTDAVDEGLAELLGGER